MTLNQQIPLPKADDMMAVGAGWKWSGFLHLCAPSCRRGRVPGMPGSYVTTRVTTRLECVTSRGEKPLINRVFLWCAVRVSNPGPAD